MAHEKLLSNDGTSLFLLNSGGHILLNGTETGVHPANLSTQKIFPKKRLVNVEFKFWLKANLLEKVIIHLHSIENRIHPKGVLIQKPKALTKSLKQTILKLAKIELTEAIKDYKDHKLYEALSDPATIGLLLLKLLKKKKVNK